MKNNSYIDGNKAKALLEKWAPVLDYTSKNIAPIEDERTRTNTAIMLENQEDWCQDPDGGLLMETSYAGSKAGGAFGSSQQGTAGVKSGDNYASGDARLPKILIPMIRRTFPELISNEIVGVQPMSGPVGLAFALRYKYNSETLGDTVIDGKSGAADNRAGRQTAPNFGSGNGKNELGWQHLDTRFTGVSTNQLSGDGNYFNFSAQDQGVAEILKNW